ncbi:hypothetical protein MY5147_003567 [Beauveria neobassiana]
MNVASFALGELCRKFVFFEKLRKSARRDVVVCSEACKGRGVQIVNISACSTKLPLIIDKESYFCIGVLHETIHDALNLIKILRVFGNTESINYGGDD